MYNYERLEFFLRAEKVVDAIAKLTLRFPKFEVYSLGDQMRRAGDSIVSNVAEGGSKKTVPDMVMYLRHALGSCQELRVQVVRAFERGYFSVEDKGSFVDELDRIGRMINGFIRRLGGKR